MLLHFKPTSVLSLLLEIWTLVRLILAVTLERPWTAEAEKSIGNYLLNQDVQVAVFWFPPDMGWGWVPFLSFQTRVHSQPHGAESELNLCFKKSLHSQIMVSSEKAADVHHQYKPGVCMTSPASHVVHHFVLPSKGRLSWRVLSDMFLFPTIAHIKCSLYCQNIELCQCLPTEVWALDQKPINQGTGKEIRFICCYWRNYYGLPYRLGCH